MRPGRAERPPGASVLVFVAVLAIGVLELLPTGAAPARAQEPADEATRGRAGLLDRLPGRLSLRAGLLFTDHETVARVDSEALGQGTTVDVERELGLESRTRDLRLDAAIGLGRRHQLQAGYLSLSRGGTRSLQTEIQWGDFVFPLDVEVESRIELELVPLTYRFAPIRTDRLDIGIGVGVFALFLDASVSAPAAEVEEAESADFPLPVVAADGVVALAPGLYATAGLKYFAIEIEGIEGAWREARTSVEYFPSRRMGIGFGYRFIRLEADGTEGIYARAEGSLLFLDYEFRGPHLYVTVGI